MEPAQPRLSAWGTGPQGKVGKAEGWSAQGLLSPAHAHVPAVMPTTPCPPMESISEFEDLH